MRKYTCNRLGSQKNLDVVAIGASLGGISSIAQVLAPLPTDFPAPILIVQHISPDVPSGLANLLGLKTRLAVKMAEEGDELQVGSVYIAPPDRHLRVNAAHTLTLSSEPKVNFTRPAVDVLFE